VALSEFGEGGRSPRDRGGSRGSRKIGIRWLCLVLAGAAGCARPNVILIVADTLRADHLGCYGYERATSSRIDDWARTGTRFTRAHATASWTTPSVVSMLTGLYPAAHGVETGFAVLSERVPTMAVAFRAAGYRTAVLSANPGFVTPVNGIGRGFDDFVVLVGPPAEGPEVPKQIPADVGLQRFVRVAEADLVTDEAVHFLRKRRAAQEPFFLYVHYIDPHADYFPPGEYRKRFGVPADSPLLGMEQRRIMNPNPLGTLPSEADLATAVSLYDGEIAFLSHEIGRLLDAVERLAPHTLVVFTADHGEEFGEHGGLGHGMTLWEEQLHVPLILVGPGVPAGMDVTVPVSLISLWQIIAELVGIEGPARPNPSLAVFMNNRRPQTTPKLFADLDRPYTGMESWAARRGPIHRHVILDMPWKLVEARNGTQRFFDLLADPAEREDVRAEDGDVSRTLAAALQVRNTAAAETRRVAAPRDEPLTPERRERLRALGYLY
jgi:arylsulfatase A-like enzyme